MDIRLTDEEQMLKKVCERFFANEFPSTVAREIEHDLGAGETADPARGFRPSIWKAMAGLDLLRLTLPQSVDGFGLGQVAAIILAEQMGRTLYQSPYLDTLIAADLIERAGVGGRHWSLLDRIGGGTCTVALAARENGAATPTDVAALQMQVSGFDSGIADGQKRFVSFARHVDYLLLAARAPQGLALYLVPRDREGIRLRRHDDIGRGEFCAVTFDQTPLHAEDALGFNGDATMAYAAALAKAHIRHAAYLVGLSQNALELTIKYTKERQQFERRIASFQSISFRLAALAARIEAARLLAQHTAWRADRGEGVGRMAAQLLAMAGDLAREVTAESIQMHGAFGLTEEAEPQRYFRRAAVDAVLLGTPAQLREEAMAMQPASTKEAVAATV